MRYILFLLLFLPLFATAQRETVTDTSYITTTNAKFFETRYIVYDNGESSTTVTLIGDSAAVRDLYANRISTEAAQLNAAAQIVIKRNKTLSELNRLDTYATALLGAARSPLLSIQTAQEWPFYANNTGVPGWTLIDASGTRTVTFDHNTAGLLRYRISTGTRERLIVFGDVIRLRNYPAANSDTELYKLPSGSYTNLDGTVKLRKP
jgi:hypothetical protein